MFIILYLYGYHFLFAFARVFVFFVLLYTFICFYKDLLTFKLKKRPLKLLPDKKAQRDETDDFMHIQ